MYGYAGHSTLITGEGDIYILHMIKNYCGTVDGNAKVLCLHRDPVSISPDRHLAVQSLFVSFLPRIPARKIRFPVNLNSVFNMLIRPPVFTIQPKQYIFTEVSSVHPAVG